MSTLLDAYKANAAHQQIFRSENLPVSKFFKGMRLEIDPVKGDGGVELLQNDNGLCVGLCAYRLHKRVNGRAANPGIPLCFSILVSGGFDFQFASGAQKKVQAGDVWCCREFNQEMAFSQPAGREMIGLTIMLPTSLVDGWLGDSSCGLRGSLERLALGGATEQSVPFFSMRTSPSQKARLVRGAGELLQSSRATLCEKLHFESCALELLAQILSINCGQDKCSQKERRIKGAIDEARDILGEEWQNPPTISVLARRIGLNECYLKSGFRKYTGCTIGEYVRQERMKRALALIESDLYSLLEIALMVGYSNPSHFSAAFKRFYGKLPSYYT